MDTDIFLNLFRQALSRVEETYYGIDRRHNPIFARHDERVFCYELYHQMRSLMEEYTAGNPNSFSSVRFQGELRKERISVDTEEQFNVKALSKQYIPDFLLHAPGNFEHQDIIIEVKSVPNIFFEPIRNDLMKIQELITRYRYQMGISLVVNNSADRMHRLLARPSNQQWIRENLQDRSRILFISKENHGANSSECFLDKCDLP